MGLQKIILSIALRIVDLLTFYVRPQEDRITFVSLQEEKMTGDFKLIYDLLKQEQKYDIHQNLILMKTNSLKAQWNYFLNCLHQLVEYKKSKLVILNDNNFVISTYKPKHCKVLQIWHACGAVKKFGNEIKRRYPIANYDYVICSAPYWKAVYSRSFDVPEDHVLVTGMPRTDLLYRTKTDEFYRKYPQCAGKKLCLYAPTFRGNFVDGMKVNSFDIAKVQQALPDWIILYKFHPLLGDVQIDSPTAINVNNEDLYQLMQVSDCMISDYSSVIFDYSLLDKPWFAYVSDLEEYKQTIGLNVDFTEFPGMVCKNEAEIIDALSDLKSFNPQKNQQFRKKYMFFTDGQNTQRVVFCIDQIMQEKMPYV